MARNEVAQLILTREPEAAKVRGSGRCSSPEQGIDDSGFLWRNGPYRRTNGRAGRLVGSAQGCGRDATGGVSQRLVAQGSGDRSIDLWILRVHERVQHLDQRSNFTRPFKPGALCPGTVLWLTEGNESSY